MALSSIKKLIPKFIKRQYRRFKKRQRVKLYFGDKVVCSICGSKFREFGPYGLIARANAECLECGSLERHRLVWKFMREKKGLFSMDKQIRLLHFAPEEFFYTRFSLNQLVKYFPCDLNPESYSYGGKIEITRVDITSIPFPDNFFDAVLCSHVLEHIPDDKKAMSEIYRVMKKDAWAILQVPVDYNRATTYEDFSITAPADREIAFGQHDHVRWYGKDYKNKLAESGFKVSDDDYVTSFSSEELFRYGLMPSELVYFCEK